MDHIFQITCLSATASYGTLTEKMKENISQLLPRRELVAKLFYRFYVLSFRFSYTTATLLITSVVVLHRLMPTELHLNFLLQHLGAVNEIRKSAQQCGTSINNPVLRRASHAFVADSGFPWVIILEGRVIFGLLGRT